VATLGELTLVGGRVGSDRSAWTRRSWGNRLRVEPSGVLRRRGPWAGAGPGGQQRRPRAAASAPASCQRAALRRSAICSDETTPTSLVRLPPGGHLRRREGSVRRRCWRPFRWSGLSRRRRRRATWMVEAQRTVW